MKIRHFKQEMNLDTIYNRVLSDTIWNNPFTFAAGIVGIPVSLAQLFTHKVCALCTKLSLTLVLRKLHDISIYMLNR